MPMTIEERRAYARAKAKAWRLAHPERKKANDAAYAAKNAEKIRAYQAKWRAEHVEERRTYHEQYAKDHAEIASKRSKQWYKDNPHQAKQSRKAYRATHPEQKKASNDKRKARKRGATETTLTAEQWHIIKEHYGHRCVYCGKKSQRLSQDHITPLAQGGTHTMHNVVPACISCNAKKHVGPPPIPVQPLLL